MRQLGAHKKKPQSVLKIIIIALFFTFLVGGFINYFHLAGIIFGGPKSVVQLITDSGLESDNNRVNILLLGIGGGNHDGPDLTDTMMLASIDKKGKDVVLVSIPRDLWVPSLEAKINSAYAYGLEKNDGLGLAKKTVAELFGIPVHYAFRVDFNGFIKAVDLVEGIDVDVENTFTDSHYPVTGKENDTCGLKIEPQVEDGVRKVYVKDNTGSATLLTEDSDLFACRYETITFKSGTTHMDGQTALKYVRSRYGTNEEGSDFKRSARQQKIIEAFRQKILSAQTVTDPKKLIELGKTFGDTIDTDISNNEIPHFLKLSQKIDTTNLRRVVLDAETKASPLEAGDPQNFKGQFVLIPKNNSWQDLAEYIQGEIFKFQEDVLAKAHKDNAPQSFLSRITGIFKTRGKENK